MDESFFLNEQKKTRSSWKVKFHDSDQSKYPYSLYGKPHKPDALRKIDGMSFFSLRKKLIWNTVQQQLQNGFIAVFPE